MPTEQQIADIIRALQAAFGDPVKSEKSEEVVETPEKTEEIVENNEKTEEIVENNEKTEEIVENNEKTEEIVENNESINITGITGKLYVKLYVLDEKLSVLDEKLGELRDIIVKMTTPPSVPYVIDQYEYSEKTIEMPADEKLRAATQTIMRGY